MGRRRHNGMQLIASLPWPIGIIFGILAFVAIRYGVGWYFVASGSSITQEMGRQLLSSGMFAPLAWMALAIFWLCALLSYFARRRRKQLLATQTGLDSLRAMSWREFEMLVGEAFRRQGYSIEETGLGGADGGVDLILRKAERTELVQCKQWRSAQISVSVVREMWGLLHHHRADAIKIVCIGDFTRDAMAFAQDKAIELIGGKRLLEIVRDVQATANDPAPARIEPPFEVAQTLTAFACPNCGGPMVHRSNRRTGESFWGCGAYPKCKGTRATRAQ